MGFKLTERVYALGRDATTPTEQAVLLALAFRANDRTGLCYPKQDTIVDMTHLHRSTVADCLNTLKRKGLLDWRSGGMSKRRGRYGQLLANDYKLILPEKPKKSKKEVMNNVAHADTAMSPTPTLQCPPGRHCNVPHADTVMSPTPTPTEYISEIDKTVVDTTPIPNRRGSAPSVSNMNTALSKLFGHGEGGGLAKAVVESSPVRMALDVCGIAPHSPSYRDNYRSFSIAMLPYSRSDLMETIHVMASERRQGLLDDVRNLPALFMSRLKLLKSAFDMPPRK